MHLEQDDRILFLGGLNTRAGGNSDDFSDIGSGFAMMVAASLEAKHPDLNLHFINTADNKENSQTMMKSLQTKCIAQKPTVVVVFAGHRDAILAEQQHEQASLKEYSRFNRALRQLIEEIQKHVTRRIILLEPFLLEIDSMSRMLRPDINQKIQIIREIARDYHCGFVSLDGIINELAIKNGASAYIADDGITYRPATHYIIAKRLLKQFD